MRGAAETITRAAGGLGRGRAARSRRATSPTRRSRPTRRGSRRARRRARRSFRARFWAPMRGRPARPIGLGTAAPVSFSANHVAAARPRSGHALARRLLSRSSIPVPEELEEKMTKKSNGDRKAPSESPDFKRGILPIPDEKFVGLTTYDAKDPNTKYPPIKALRPPKGAPNVL